MSHIPNHIPRHLRVHRPPRARRLKRYTPLPTEERLKSLRVCISVLKPQSGFSSILSWLDRCITALGDAQTAEELEKYLNYLCHQLSGFDIFNEAQGSPDHSYKPVHRIFWRALTTTEFAVWDTLAVQIRDKMKCLLRTPDMDTFRSKVKFLVGQREVVHVAILEILGYTNPVPSAAGSESHPSQASTKSNSIASNPPESVSNGSGHDIASLHQFADDQPSSTLQTQPQAPFTAEAHARYPQAVSDPPEKPPNLSLFDFLLTETVPPPTLEYPQTIPDPPAMLSNLSLFDFPLIPDPLSDLLTETVSPLTLEHCVPYPQTIPDMLGPSSNLPSFSFDPFLTGMVPPPALELGDPPYSTAGVRLECLPTTGTSSVDSELDWLQMFISPGTE